MHTDNLTIQRLEELSRLKIPAEEYGTLRRELDEILTCFDKIAHCDETEPAGTELAARDETALRADTISAPLTRDALLINAPETENGMFAVPGVMNAAVIE